jgi:hypothetical protein
MLSAVPTRRELLVWLMAILVGSAVIVSVRSDAASAGFGPPPAPETHRVFIATGGNYPDALAAAAAAGIELAPVLLVQQDAIPQVTLDELNRLEPSGIIIVGGEAVVSAGVQSDLDDLVFNPHVVRISGANRYETAAELSQFTFPTSGKYPRVAFKALEGIGGLTGGPSTNLLVANIEAPDYGYLVIHGGADFSYDSNPAIVQCWITVEASEVDGSRRYSDLDSISTEDDCVTNAAEVVQPGELTVEFRAMTDANVNVEVGSMTVLWIPFGHLGESPVP